VATALAGIPAASRGRTWWWRPRPTTPAPLLASTGGCDKLVAQIDALEHEPIVSVYLALGKGQKLPEPMIGLVSGSTAGPAQWVFDRGQLGGPEGLFSPA
jgi:hypothetical protein